MASRSFSGSVAPRLLSRAHVCWVDLGQDITGLCVATLEIVATVLPFPPVLRRGHLDGDKALASIGWTSSAGGKLGGRGVAGDKIRSDVGWCEREASTVAVQLEGGGGGGQDNEGLGQVLWVREG